MASLTLTMGMYEVGYGFDQWKSISGKRVVFSGDKLDLTIPVAVDDWQSGTHLGSGTPGTNQCGTGAHSAALHGNNVKYVDPATMQFWHYASEALNDNNLEQNFCTFRLHFAETGSVVTEPRVFIFDGTTFGNYASHIKVQAFERGVGALAWTPINDGATGLGGDYNGDRLDLEERPIPADNHYWYIAMSASPEALGEFDDFAIGATLVYS